MKVFLAGLLGRESVVPTVHEKETEMKVYLAGDCYKRNVIPTVHERNGISTWKDTLKEYTTTIAKGQISPEIRNHKPFILDSFYYAGEKTESLLKYYGDYMLDSGAFTFMGGFSFTKNESKEVVWEDYIELYADYINRNKVEKFFELDIDSVVGYEKVKAYRKKIEKLTNRQPIPVWHSTRGIEDFKRICDEYPYVALGGIVGGEWKNSAEKYIPWFISEAHKKGAKIHGLGFTKLPKLKEYHFDSVDSTAWTAGNRFGYIYRFRNGEMLKTMVPHGKKLRDQKLVALNNYIEWLKYQRWAVNNI